MALMLSSQFNLALNIFSSKLYKIRARTFRVQPLDYLGKKLRPFATPKYKLECRAQLRGYTSTYLWQHNSSNVSNITVCQVLAQDDTVVLTVDLL